MNQTDPTLSVAASADPNQTSPHSSSSEAPRLGPNTFIGDYEILAEIAHGGMGVVYKARQGKLNRIVALKMTRAELATSQDNQRFKAEAEASAKLDHPNIVPIYEVGEHDGRHFFSMAFVEGRSLAEEIAANPLPPRQAAAVMQQVAEAVAYAHANGIIHRDLKPSNILLDATGQPRVTDFGLAKRADGDSSLTQAGQVMGTPSYMSPEQAEGKNDTVGPLADIYSLGATLYCLITGRPPFQSANVVDTLKQVLEREPVAPHYLNPAVGRDMDTICLKCLEKRPEKRYASATALADDLERFLEDRSILARPVGDAEKVVRWCRRNPVVAASLAGIAAIFIAAFVLVSWSYVRAEDARRDEAKQREVADAARDEAQQREQAERWERYRSNLAAASAAMQVQNSSAARMALEDAPPEHRNWEWQYLHNQLDGAALVLQAPGGKYWSHTLSPSGRQVAVCGIEHNDVYLYDVVTGKLDVVLRGHTGPATSVAYRPDGKQVASVGNDQTVRLWDPATGQQTAVLKTTVAPTNLDRSLLVKYNSDGSRLVTYPYIDGQAGANRLWDVTSGKEVAVLAKSQDMNFAVAVSPDGTRVAAASGDYVNLSDAVTGRQYAALGPHASNVRFLAFSPDGKRLASSCDEGSNTIYLWDGENGKEVAELPGHTGIVNALLFSPDGSRLLSASKFPDNTARLWDAAAGRSLASLKGHKNEINTVAFSSDGKRVATSSSDQTARLWDGYTGQPFTVLGGHTGEVVATLFNSDGTRLVTTSVDSTLRLWNAQSGELIGVLRGHSGRFDRLLPPIFTPDGSRLVSGTTDGTVRVWDMKLVERNGILSGHESYIYDVAFSPNGEQVASAAWDGTARLWDATTGRETGLLQHGEKGIIPSVSYSRNGRQLVTVEREKKVSLWDVTSPKASRESQFGGIKLWENRACLNPEDTLLASGSIEGPVFLWENSTGKEIAQLKGHGRGEIAAEVSSIDVAFHPDGTLLASTGYDGTIRLWDVATRAPVAVLREHTHTVWRIAFSVDGKLLASCSSDKTVRLWDVRTREQLKAIPLGSIVYGVAFSPDGTRLAAACRDNTIRLIDVAHRQQVAELRGHADYVHAVDWSPDGTRIVSGSGDFMVRIWDSLSAQERAKLPAATNR